MLTKRLSRTLPNCSSRIIFELAAVLGAEDTLVDSNRLDKQFAGKILSGQLHRHVTLPIEYRVAKTHRVPYIQRSFSAKEPYN